MRDMRHMRERFNVVTYHSSTVTSSAESRSDPESFNKIDAWVVGEELPINLSDDASSFLTKRGDDIGVISSGAIRLFSTYSPTAASAFTIFPGIIATNLHVIEQLPSQFSASNLNEVCRAEASIRGNATMINSTHDLIYNAKGDSVRSLDPVGGHTGDFDYVDFVAYNLKIKEGDPYFQESNVIYVPSARAASPGQAIITISYPGAEELNNYDGLGYSSEYLSYLPSFKQLKQIFGGFKSKVASYGKVVHPYHLKSNKWIENRGYISNPETEQFVISNEATMAGSSGGATFLHDFRVATEKDKNGNEWVLVETSAIYFGGDFFACSKCLETPPSKRSALKPHEVIKLNSCQTCVSGNKTPVAYNYGISFHHPLIVQFYEKTMKPKFNDLFGPKLPQLLEEYFQVHKK